MSYIVRALQQAWRLLVTLLVIAAVGVAAWTVPSLRAKSIDLWQQALQWAGLAERGPEEETIYWCPMHPQIKRNRPNEVCPICNMALVPLEGKPSDTPPEQLTLTPQQVQQAGVVYQPVVRRKLYRQINTTGRMEYDERQLAKITSWVLGKSRIDKLHIDFTGTRVKKGELMAELYSRQLISDQEYLRILLQSDSALRDTSVIESTKKRLADQGLTAAQIERLAKTGQVLDTIPVYAPMGGTVIRREVQQGQYVNEGDVLFEIVDLGQLWLFVDIYEEELPLVHEGQTAEITVRSFPTETFRGTVAFVPPEVQRDTRTARVRIDVPNADHRLKPGMYARVRLREELGEQLAVPHNAVLWSGQRQVVIVRQGAGTFQPREIQIDATWAYPSDAGYQPGGQLEFGAHWVRYHPVLAGLNPGDEVVTSGAFLLNAESQFQSVLTKMLPPASRSASLEEIVGEKVAVQLRELLQSYYALSETLARDDLTGIPSAAEKLAQAGESLAHQPEADEVSDKSGEIPKQSLGTGGQSGGVPRQSLGTRAQAVAEAARSLADPAPGDLKAARTGFASVSRAVVQLLDEHGGPALLGREMFVFECPMAGPFGYKLWLSPDETLRNPYMGRKMLTCGKELATLNKSTK